MFRQYQFTKSEFTLGRHKNFIKCEFNECFTQIEAKQNLFRLGYKFVNKFCGVD